MRKSIAPLHMSLCVSFLLICATLSAQKAPVAMEYPVLVSNIEGIKEYKLSNGLQILLIPDATQSNMVVNIVYKVGSRHEGYGETGMAHLLEHMLFKSTKNLGDIKKMLSDKGGNANGTTWYDRTNYYEIFPSSDDNLRWSIQMEADRMIHATILQSDLDKEFSVVRNEFEIGENDPAGVLTERVLSTAYLWHNYGKSTIGSKEDIERVKASRLRLFYEKYYQPDNATLIVAGKFDEAKALQYISEYLSVIPRPTRVLEPTYTLEPAQDGERFVELRRSGDIYSIQAAYHTPALADPDYAAVDVLLNILATNPSGYLYKALIETQLASSVDAYTQTLHDPGFAMFSLTVPKDKNLEQTRNKFTEALNAIPGTPYTEADVKRGKAMNMKQLQNITNNTIGFAITLTEFIGSGDYRLWFLTRDRMEQVSLSDIQRVAQKYFIPNNRTFGVFIPSDNEVRVLPEEYQDHSIQDVLKGYKGHDMQSSDVTFENTISNIKSNLTSGSFENGFRYSFVKKPLKGGKVTATFRLPVSDEKSLQGKSVTASLMADLLKAGTKSMTKEQIKDKLDELKSSISFFWYGQTLTISINTYEKELPEVFTILKQCLTESVFPENELIKTKTESKAYLESQMKDPQSVAYVALNRVLNTYPYGHILYNYSPKEEIDEQAKVTRQQILDFYSTYLGASNGYGTMLGNIDASKASALLNSVFASWKSPKAYTRFLPAFTSNAGHYERINTPDKENGALYCGMTIQMSKMDADYPALLMANEMLGSGGFLTSRIPMRLREKEGISYGAGSYLSVPIEHNFSEWGAYSFFNPDAVNRVDSAMHEEIEIALKQGFTDDELKQSIVSWKNERRTSLGYDGFLINLINDAMRSNVGIEQFEEIEKKVDRLSVDEVNAALRKYLDVSRICYVFAGDFERVKK